MKVICAGAPKTGTKSMAVALRRLGYKTYDFLEQVSNFNEEWHAMFAQGKVPDFKAMFDDVDAVTDTPASFVYEEIAECFPEAKVVLTIRDEDAWLKSVREHMSFFSPWLKILIYLSNYKLARLLPLIRVAMFGTNNPNASFLHLKRYRSHNDRVRQVIPAERLLVFDVKQGWKPLCDFLGHEVPDEPFPRKNVKLDSVKRGTWQQIRPALYVLFFIMVLLIAVIMYFCV
jgi:hypothetical protein